LTTHYFNGIFQKTVREVRNFSLQDKIMKKLILWQVFWAFFMVGTYMYLTHSGETVRGASLVLFTVGLLLAVRGVFGRNWIGSYSLMGALVGLMSHYMVVSSPTGKAPLELVIFGIVMAMATYVVTEELKKKAVKLNPGLVFLCSICQIVAVFAAIAYATS
jgi:hypothetical protein